MARTSADRIFIAVSRCTLFRSPTHGLGALEHDLAHYSINRRRVATAGIPPKTLRQNLLPFEPLPSGRKGCVASTLER